MRATCREPDVPRVATIELETKAIDMQAHGSAADRGLSRESQAAAGPRWAEVGRPAGGCDVNKGARAPEGPPGQPLAVEVEVVRADAPLGEVAELAPMARKVGDAD